MRLLSYACVIAIVDCTRTRGYGLGDVVCMCGYPRQNFGAKGVCLVTGVHVKFPGPRGCE